MFVNFIASVVLCSLVWVQIAEAKILLSKEKCCPLQAKATENFKRLFIMGDRSIPIPQTTADMKTFCDDMLGRIEEVRGYTRNCTDGFTYSLFDSGLFTSARHYRGICRSTSGKRETLDALRCADHPAAFEKLHLCQDTMTMIMVKHVMNYKEDNQIPGLCCAANIAFDCLKQHGKESCGPLLAESDATDWYHDHVKSSVGSTLDAVCGSKYGSIQSCVSTNHTLQQDLSREWNRIYASPRRRAGVESHSLIQSVISVFDTLSKEPGFETIDCNHA